MLAALFGIESKDQAVLALGAGVVLAIFLVVAGGMAIHAWNLARFREMEREQMDQEADLKRLMIERGMQADEIERVLAAKLAKPELTVARSA